MKLILIEPYKNAGGRQLVPGQIIEVDATETKRLLEEKIATEYQPIVEKAKKTTKRKTTKRK